MCINLSYMLFNVSIKFVLSHCHYNLGVLASDKQKSPRHPHSLIQNVFQVGIHCPRCQPLQVPPADQVFGDCTQCFRIVGKAGSGARL